MSTIENNIIGANINNINISVSLSIKRKISVIKQIQPRISSDNNRIFFGDLLIILNFVFDISINRSIDKTIEIIEITNNIVLFI